MTCSTRMADRRAARAADPRGPASRDTCGPMLGITSAPGTPFHRAADRNMRSRPGVPFRLVARLQLLERGDQRVDGGLDVVAVAGDDVPPGCGWARASRVVSCSPARRGQRRRTGVVADHVHQGGDRELGKMAEERERRSCSLAPMTRGMAPRPVTNSVSDRARRRSWTRFGQQPGRSLNRSGRAASTPPAAAPASGCPPTNGIRRQPRPRRRSPAWCCRRR